MNHDFRLPMVEIFETIEGEGTRAGYPTIFVRLFGCNLRCTWCDTLYSYPPAQAEHTMTIDEIVSEVSHYSSRHLCLTGGEPLLYKEASLALIQTLSEVIQLEDIHIETNGAIPLDFFIDRIHSPKVRYIMDVKLPDSGESDKMFLRNLTWLRKQDEVKFVIASETDFYSAIDLLKRYPTHALPLFSPVWDAMPAKRLVELMLENKLAHVKFNLQIHKVVWDPSQRGV